MERGPKPVSEMSTNGHAPASVPQQKKGFFRRLSLASGGINSTAQVQPSNKLGKRNKDKETQVQGQAYEQLDVGPAPSGNKIAEDMKRTKSKDRGFWSRGDKGTTPTPSLANQSPKPSFQPPVAASYSRSTAFPELGSSFGPYPSFPTANPSHQQQQQQSSQQSYRQQPSFGGFSQEGPYPQMGQIPQAQIHQPQAQYPQTQRPQQMYQQQNQFRPFRTPSQNRVPVHPALASSPSPVSTTTTSPAQNADPTRSGSVRSPYGSPQDGRAPRAFGGPSLGQENVTPGNGREEAARKVWLNGEEPRAPPQLQPINPAPRSSSRTYPDMRSPPPPQPIAAPPPRAPNPPGEPSMPSLANVASHNPNANSNGEGSWKTMMPAARAGAGINGNAGVTHTRERSASLRPQPPPLIIPSDPRQPQAQAQSYPPVQPPPHSQSHPQSQPQSQYQSLPETQNVQSSQSQSVSQPQAQVQGQIERSHRAEQKLQEVQRGRNQNRESRFEDAEHFEIPREAPPAYTPSPARERVVSPVASLSLPPGAAPAQVRGQSSQIQQQQQRHQQQQDFTATAAIPKELESQPQSQAQPQTFVQPNSSTQSQIPRPVLPRPAPRMPSNSSPTVPTRATQPQPHSQILNQPPTTPTRPRSETPRRMDRDGREPMSEASKYARAVAVAMRSDSMSSSETGARHATVTSRDVGAGTGAWDTAAENPPTPSKMERLHTPKASMSSPVGSEQGDGSPRKRPLPHVPGGGASVGPGVGMSQRGSMIVSKSNKAPAQVENQVEKEGAPDRRFEKEIRREEPPMVREERPVPVERVGKEASLPLENDSLRPPEPIAKSPKMDRPVSQTLAFEFPRSPTLPPLVDPRNAPPSSTTSPLATPSAHQGSEQEHDPISKWTAGVEKNDETVKTSGTLLSPSWGGGALPPRGSSMQGLGVPSGLSHPPPGKRTVSSPLSGRSSPMFMSPVGGMPSPRAPSQNQLQYPNQGSRSVSQPLPTLPNSNSIPTLPPLLPSEPIPELVPRGPRPKATITFILAYPSIQAVLLPYLSINSFLSLTGSSEQVRRRFTGEMVGRWVMREWGEKLNCESG